MSLLATQALYRQVQRLKVENAALCQQAGQTARRLNAYLQPAEVLSTLRSNSA